MCKTCGCATSGLRKKRKTVTESHMSIFGHRVPTGRVLELCDNVDMYMKNEDYQGEPVNEIFGDFIKGNKRDVLGMVSMNRANPNPLTNQARAAVLHSDTAKAKRKVSGLNARAFAFSQKEHETHGALLRSAHAITKAGGQLEDAHHRALSDAYDDIGQISGGKDMLAGQVQRLISRMHPGDQAEIFDKLASHHEKKAEAYGAMKKDMNQGYKPHDAHARSKERGFPGYDEHKKVYGAINNKLSARAVPGKDTNESVSESVNNKGTGNSTIPKGYPREHPTKRGLVKFHPDDDRYWEVLRPAATSHKQVFQKDKPLNMDNIAREYHKVKTERERLGLPVTPEEHRKASDEWRKMNNGK